MRFVSRRCWFIEVSNFFKNKSNASSFFLIVAMTTIAGIAKTNPVSVVISASEIPPAISPTVFDPSLEERPLKVVSIPPTVPRSPVKGAALTMMATNLIRLPILSTRVWRT